MPTTVETRSEARQATVPPVHVPAPPPVRASRTRSVLMIVSVLAVIAVLLAWHATTKSGNATFTPVTVQNGSIVKTISATGKLQAVTTVDVGTQASGTISEILTDYNRQVHKGDVIARLDPAQFQAQLTQANAELANSIAAVQSQQASALNADAAVTAAQANVDRMRSMVSSAKITLDRTTQLVEAKVSARQDLDTAKAAYDQAVAQEQQAEAQVAQARAQAQTTRAQIAQAQASVKQAQAAVQVAAVNVDHTIIRAPIDGVVVARNVNVGQTVAASLQAPVLFSIANDLTQMQVLADIDEADVGQLGPNSQVTFTVDAYPSDTFHGSISQIRLAPQTVQNVVTYTAVIDVANPDLKLKPGMTANVTAAVARRDNVLTIPNVALRFRPDNVKDAPKGPTVWRVDSEDNLQPVRVSLGLSDGISTEVTDGNLHAGDRIAVPGQTARGGGSGQRAGSNPLAPMGGRAPRR